MYFFECAMCMCVYHDVLMHAVKIMNGRSANTWHVCRKLANHRAVRNLSTPRCDGKSCLYSCVCPDTCRRLSNRTSFVDDSLLYSKDNDILFFLYIFIQPHIYILVFIEFLVVFLVILFCCIISVLHVNHMCFCMCNNVTK